MSNRLLTILLGILAAFVAAFLVARLVTGGRGGPEPAPFDLAADAELEIDSVVIVSPDDTLRLHAGDGWTVNGLEAVGNAGESLKRALEEARVGDLVSRNPENHERLGVTEDTGRQVTVYAGGSAQLSLIIGERAQLFDQAYVRRPGDDQVYTLRGNLVSLAERGVDDWRNKEILSAARGDVQRIEFAYPDASFALARDSAGWRIEPSGAAADEATVSSLLSQLAGLSAIGFAADSVADTLTWEPPTARVRVLGPGDAELGELTFLEREENVGFYVRRRGSPTVYTLSSFSGDQILKREEDLVASGSSG